MRKSKEKSFFSLKTHQYTSHGLGDQNFIYWKKVCILTYKIRSRIVESHQYVRRKLPKKQQNLNAKIRFFSKRGNLYNTLRKGAKFGSKNFGSKGVPLYVPFFGGLFFVRLVRESVQNGVPQNRGVDTLPFSPSIE